MQADNIKYKTKIHSFSQEKKITGLGSSNNLNKMENSLAKKIRKRNCEYII